MPAHIRAESGSVAPSALVCGDPDRVKSLSKLLSGAKLVNSNRGFLVYTGVFGGGARISIATHGIGQPSIAIVVEELNQLGVRSVVRLGTCGSMDPRIGVGDFVVATGASYAVGGTITQYLDQSLSGIALAQTPDIALTNMILKELEPQRTRVHTSDVYSSDSFYGLKKSLVAELRAHGNRAVEMEAATLFMLGKAKGMRTAALFVASNSVLRRTKLLTHEELEGRMLIAAKAALAALSR